jgi:hypothetical protein
VEKGPAMTEVSNDKKIAETLSAKLEAALNSAAQVVRDFNSAHAKRTSSGDGAGPRIHPKADRFDRGAQQ